MHGSEHSLTKRRATPREGEAGPQGAWRAPRALCTGFDTSHPGRSTCRGRDHVSGRSGNACSDSYGRTGGTPTDNVRPGRRRTGALWGWTFADVSFLLVGAFRPVQSLYVP